MRTKSRKADLEGKKILFFETGLIISLAIALAAFEWPSKGDIYSNLPNIKQVEVIEEIIPRTKPEEIRQPAPPIVPIEKINIIDNEADIPKEDENPFEDITTDQYADLLKNIRTIEEDVDEVIEFMRIEIKPTFMGGDYNRFNEWVFKNLRYPDEAARNGIQGKVYVEFLIDVDGMVKNVRVLKGVDPLLDQEAVRVISSSPPWKPGFQRDKPTKVVFTFPINFRLKN